MPTTTETGPVRTRSRRRCDNPRNRRDSHTTWTRARGLHTFHYTVTFPRPVDSELADVFNRLFYGGMQ